MNDDDITAVLERLIEPLEDEVGSWDDVSYVPPIAPMAHLTARNQLKIAARRSSPPVAVMAAGDIAGASSCSRWPH